MRSFAFVAAALASVIAATPLKPHELQDAGIAYTLPNGTFTKPVPVPVDGVTQKLASPGPVSYVFISPPFDGRRYKLTECSFDAPTNKSLGTISVRKPTTVPVNPPSTIGYVSCQ